MAEPTEPGYHQRFRVIRVVSLYFTLHIARAASVGANEFSSLDSVIHFVSGSFLFSIITSVSVSTFVIFLVGVRLYPLTMVVRVLFSPLLMVYGIIRHTKSIAHNQKGLPFTTVQFDQGKTLIKGWCNLYQRSWLFRNDLREFPHR